MKRHRSLYARPVIVRGQQCAEAPLDPGGATKQLPARRYLALEGGLTARACMGCRAPQAPSTQDKNTVGRPQHAVARRGGPGGPVAGRAFVSLSTSSASVRCPVSGASDQCPHLPVHGTDVQCPVRASERPGVRCPAPGVGVRCLCVAASAVSGRSEVLERGGGAGSRTAGMAGVGVVACGVHDRLVVCPGRNLTVEAGAGRAGPAEASAWVDLATAHHLPRPRPSPAWPTRMGRMRARIALRWGSRVRSEVATTLRGHRGGPGPSRLVAASLPGWTATCACGRAAAASWSERRLLDANDALTCEYGGGGEGI